MVLMTQSSIQSTSKWQDLIILVNGVVREKVRSNFVKFVSVERKSPVYLIQFDRHCLAT